MKNSKFLIIAVIAGCLFFSIANAETIYQKRLISNREFTTSKPEIQSNAGLPLKNQVLFLTVTGIIISLKYTIDASRKHKFQKI